MGHKPIRLIVICIAVVSALAILAGAALSAYDKRGGDQLIGVGGTGLGGLIALLSSTRAQSDEPVEVKAAETLPVREETTLKPQIATLQQKP